MKKFIFITIISLFIFSCETDFEVIGEWEDHTIVYGLINPVDPVQYIRVQRSFLGELPADSMAQITDSIYYEEAIVNLYEIYAPSINSSAVRIAGIDRIIYTARHPAKPAMMPPRNGPSIKPVAPPHKWNPKARPLFSSGKYSGSWEMEDG